MQILYGVPNQYLDVTDHFQNCVISIPKGDPNRARVFSDPVFGKLKHIVIIDDHNQRVILNHTQDYFNTRENGVLDHRTSKSMGEQLMSIHRNLRLQFGNSMDEYPEQIMAVTFIRPHNRVLEIGGNIGRNSCVIASICKYLLVLESHPQHAHELMVNRDTNRLVFDIEPSALSKQRLQQKDWLTKPIENNRVEPGWTEIRTISFEELSKKYLESGDTSDTFDTFDTLVADCEGALFYILKDMPEVLDTIKTIILENDFTDKSQGDWVHAFFRANGFSVVYEEAGGWGHYRSCFFQVWKRSLIFDETH